MLNIEINKLKELLNYSENFIYNKEQADIDKIQEKLKFSTQFGKETFYNLERFYKANEENKLYEDYQLQLKGKQYFKKNPYILENLRIELNNIKNIRSIFLNDFYLLDETVLYELKIFILSYYRILDIFNSTNIDISLYNLNLHEIIEIFDPVNKSSPTFYLNPSIDSELESLILKREKIINKINIEKNNIISNYLKNFNIEFSFEIPKIILKEDSNFENLSKNINNFIIVEDNFIYIKILPKKNEILLSYEFELQEIEKKIYDKKTQVLVEISKKIFEKKDYILKAYLNIGLIDSFLTKVNFAIEINGIIPEIDYENFYIEEGRNIFLEENLKNQNMIYTPLNINISKGLSILTGSNMGGKTCVLKTIAQIAYIVHAGLMVPAKKIKIPLFNGIFISGPEKTLVSEGLSSFGYEIFTLRNVWKEKDNFFLFLFDEPAKGTNPSEGTAIVKSMAYFLSNSNSFSLISTHYEGIWENISCKKFRIKGIDENAVSKLINIISKDKFSINDIHNLIDHSVIEIKDKLEVPKSAITILKLFSFDEYFIQKCYEFLQKK
jgi:hypothetical protein